MYRIQGAEVIYFRTIGLERKFVEHIVGCAPDAVIICLTHGLDYIIGKPCRLRVVGTEGLYVLSVIRIETIICPEPHRTLTVLIDGQDGAVRKICTCIYLFKCVLSSRPRA